MAALLAMTTDLDTDSSAGLLYGGKRVGYISTQSLLGAPLHPVGYKGGLPGYRLKHVLDYIGDNLAEDLSLTQLAAVAGMSPHYFAELFKRSTGQAPHRYVLLQRIERKTGLRGTGRSVIEVGLDVGFQTPSHFARMFRKFVGASPSSF